MRSSEWEKLLREMHTSASDRLDERVYRTIDQAAASGTLWRKIMGSPITRIAIAAVFAIGLFCLAQQMIGREDGSSRPHEEIVGGTPLELPEQPVLIQGAAGSELQDAQRLFEQGDTAGLLTLLVEGREESQRAVARYLEQIGGVDAIPVLRRLAEAWQGPAGENPFQQAIEAIEAGEDG